MIQNLINNNDSKQFQEYKQKKSEKPGTFNLSYQNIETITTFQTPEKIFCLNFSNNLKKNLENLDNLKNLKELDLSHNNLTNLEGLDSCKSLTLLNLSNNFIDSLEFIPKLSMLGDLNLNKNNLKNLKGLENLKDLKKISISSNKLQNIGLLPNFNKYEELILYDNHLETINPNAFEYANSLVYLDLSKNYLQNLNFLTPLKNIQTLILSKNFIEKIEITLKLEKLENLDLSENYISETQGFESIFPFLFTLDLSTNQLLSQYELKFCSEMPYLYDLNIMNNAFHNEESEKDIIETYPNLERLNKKSIKEIGKNIAELIKELKIELKNKEKYPNDDEKEFNLHSSDTEILSKEEQKAKLISQMTNPLSVSLNIDKEIDVENQILEFKRFLKNAEEDIATIRNKYISKVGKKKYQELHRKSLGSFKDIKKSHDEDTKSNISQVLDDNFNKSLPNFKKFIVRKQKINNIPRSTSNAIKNSENSALKSPNGFPLNSLNVPMKLLNSSEKKKEVKKLIKGNVRGPNFIENLRENLGLKFEDNTFKNHLNGNILSSKMIRKNFMTKK